MFQSLSNYARSMRVWALFRNVVLSRNILRSFQRKISTSGASRTAWTIDDVVQHLSKPDTINVVVMAGAGISTPSGIPDFRTPGTGLYDNLQKYNLPYAEAIFDIDYFRTNPKPFFMLAKELYPGNFRPNGVHYFCRLLYEKGKLLRMYTQNIDGLEHEAGIPLSKLIEAHGTFRSATCVACYKKYDAEAIRATVFAGEIPLCTECEGIVKPDVVFFGEMLPPKFNAYAKDIPLADTVIIMGTSLEVQPFGHIASLVGEDTPRVLINKSNVNALAYSDHQKDVALLGDVLEIVNDLALKLNWKAELDNLINNNEHK